MIGLDAWIAQSQRRPVALRSGEFEISRRVEGDGPWLTLLHGFPSSSWDYARVAPALAREHKVLTFDFLGFGDSDKPTGHDYSLLEQADLVESIWQQHGVTRTALMAHDIGLSVVLELLARRAESRLATQISAVVFMNGILYVEAYTPLLIQRMLRNGLVGPIAARLTNRALFTRELARVFGPSHRPEKAELHEHWRAIQRRDGPRNYHRIAQYMREAHVHRERWQWAHESSDVPALYIWGMADPVTGRANVERLRAHRPDARIVAREDVAHYPHLEMPDEVSRSTLEHLRRVQG